MRRGCSRMGAAAVLVLSPAVLLGTSCGGSGPESSRTGSSSAVSHAAPVGPVLSTSDGIAEALAIGQRYVESREYRRALLEESLLTAYNGYAQLRLSNYAASDTRGDGSQKGWEDLPVVSLPSAPLSVSVSGTEEPVLGSVLPVPFSLSDFTWEHESVLALGRRAFAQWPIRRRISLERDLVVGEPLSDSALGDWGLWRNDSDLVGGLLVVNYPDGTSGLSLSCSSCHALPNEAGQLEYGRSSGIQLSFSASPNDLVWPAGNIDVTPDGVHNPVKIADLRNTRYQSRLHHTGNLKNSLGALAVRIETLLITSVGNALRPPREISFSLAYYLWQLGEEHANRAEGLHAETNKSTSGAILFRQNCATCHSGKWGSGNWVSQPNIDSDPAAANSSTRGSGGYRVPSLLGSAERRLGHLGATESFSEWLLPNAQENYRGHPPDVELSRDEVRQLESFLRIALTPRQ